LLGFFNIWCVSLLFSGYQYFCWFLGLLCPKAPAKHLLFNLCIGMVACPIVFSLYQVLKDFMTEPTFDEEDAGNQKELSAEWYSNACGFLKENQDGTKVKVPRAKRLASWEWCCSIDNLFKIMTGTGLEQFVVADYKSCKLQVPGWPPAQEPSPQPWLGMCADQCSGNLTPFCFLQYNLGLCATLIYDPNHRPNNDLWLAAKQAGLWSVVRLKGVSFNVFYGPFDSAGHWGKSLAAAQELAKRSGVQDPLFLHFLPKIARDRMEEERLTEPGYAEEIFELVFEAVAVSKKMSKMALTRWGSWYDCWRQWRPWHHLRCLAWIYMGIVLGWAIRIPGRIEPKMSTQEAKRKDKQQKEEVEKGEAKKQSMQEEATEAIQKDLSDGS
jgi:hypothetical protein